MASSQVVLQSFKRQPSLEAYMQELLRIRSTTNGVGSKWPNSGEEEQSDIEENVGGIEADPDAIWLENAGFGSIVSQLKDDSGVEEGRDILFEASGLPKKHQAVVRKRMDTLRTTIKRQKDGDKKRYGHRSDVRNIFNSSRHSNTKTPGVVTTAVKTLLHSPLNSNSPTVSPSPHNSPGTSPRGSPTPTRHFQSSPSHSNGTSIPHSSLTTTAAASPATAQVSAVTGRQTNTSSLVRASESLTERDRVRIRVRSTHSHHQSSDSGIVSRDSSSSNEYTPDGHLDTSSPEPTGPNRGSSDGSQSDNDYNHHQSMSEEHRAPDVSPTSSTNSPTQEDIKLDFETRTSQSPLANETQELPDFMVMPDALE